tara:strand:- start:193 stop:1380 length:1188 start_codon:yes stop_codon:yes gene_type:complete
MNHLYVKLNQLSFLLFTLIYALYGSPTISNIGVKEILLMILIFGSINFKLVLEFLKENFKSKTLIFFIFLLIFGLIIAFINHNQFSKIIRDLIFYGYIVYFFYLFYVIKNRHFNFNLILFFIFFVGVIFLLRSYYVSLTLHIDINTLIIEKSYLIINISLLFLASLFIIIISKDIKKFISNGLIFILFPIIFLFLYLYFTSNLTIRSSLVTFFGVFLYLFALNVKKYFSKIKLKKSNYILILSPLIIIGIYVFFIEPNELIFKMKNNFFNNRLSEFSSVQNTLISYSDYIFGKGIGSLLLSKSTNGYFNFVHNFFLHFYFKHGFLGLFFSIYFIYKIFMVLFKNILDLNLITIAGFFPIIYGLMFSTSYKTLEFWMLLILMMYNKNKNIYDLKSI